MATLINKTREEYPMATSNAVHILNNVEALYPRLNTTYKYDTKANDGKGQSVPCEPLD